MLSKDCLSKVSIGAFLDICEKVSETLNKIAINIEIAFIIMLSLYFFIYIHVFLAGTSGFEQLNKYTINIQLVTGHL